MLSTGTDEHGLKIQQASAKAGSEPLPFCDKGADVFKVPAALLHQQPGLMAKEPGRQGPHLE